MKYSSSGIASKISNIHTVYIMYLSSIGGDKKVMDELNKVLAS